MTPGLPGPESGRSTFHQNVGTYLPVGSAETSHNKQMSNNTAERTSNLAHFRRRYTDWAVGLSTNFRLLPTVGLSLATDQSPPTSS